MTNEEARDLMTKRGYTIHSHSESRLNLVKHVRDIIIHAEVNPESNQVNLVTIENFLSVSTGAFSLNHPHFKDLFENSIIRAGIALRKEFE